MSTNFTALAEQLYLSHNGNINPTIQTYLDVLKNGLGAPSAEAKNKLDKNVEVVIVGAGISGLLSALQLADYGFTVKLLEANKSRVGGRIKTFGDPTQRSNSNPSPFQDPNQYAEAGAMRFPTIHPLLMKFIEHYELEDKRQQFFLVDVEDPNQTQPVNVRNTVLRSNSFQERRSRYAENPVNTNQGFFESGASVPEQEAGALLDAAFDPVRDLFSFKKADGSREDKPYNEWLGGWAQVIEKYDSYSLGRFLREVAGLDERSIDLIGTLENLTSRMPLSFIHSFLGRADINPGNTYYELQGGSYQLTQVLADKVNAHANITLIGNARMTNLHFYDANMPVKGYNVSNFKAKDELNKRVVVTVANEDGTEKDGNDAFVEGEFAIVTIPFSSMRTVNTMPELSYGKRRAISELHYDSATKVVLEFSQRWWEFTDAQWRTELSALKKAGDITQEQYSSYIAELDGEFEQGGYPALNAFGGGSMTDGLNRGMYYPSHKVSGSNEGVILASYTWSGDASRWDSMDDKMRYEYALRGLKVMHGNKIEPFSVYKQTDGAKGAATQSWARSPYAFGEAAVFQPSQLTLLHPDIPTPEGPVFFAGEHTSLKHAWIEGSLESAIRSALEVKEALNETPVEPAQDKGTE